MKSLFDLSLLAGLLLAFAMQSKTIAQSTPCEPVTDSPNRVTVLPPTNVGDESNASGRSLDAWGDYVVAGESGGDDFANGRVVVYHRNGIGWEIETELSGAFGAYALEEGYSVAMWDKSVMWTFADQESGTGNSARAFLYEKDNTGWNAVSILDFPVADELPGPAYTRSYAAALTDEFAVYGRGGGAVYTFAKINNDWTYQGYIKPAGSGLDFGRSTALYGNYLAIWDGLESVHLYHHDGTVWMPHSILTQPEGTTSGDLFGFSLSMWENVLLIGSPQDDEAANDAGAVYAYQLQNGSWSYDSKWMPCDLNSNDGFGQDVDLSPKRAVVGTRALSKAYAYQVQKVGANLSFLQDQKLTEPHALSQIGSLQVAAWDHYAVVADPFFVFLPDTDTDGMINLYDFCDIPEVDLTGSIASSSHANDASITATILGDVSYEFSIDGGDTWVGNGSNSYTFSNLASGSYTIQGRNDQDCYSYPTHINLAACHMNSDNTLAFDGDDKVIIDNDPALEITEEEDWQYSADLSVSVWVYPSMRNSSATILSKAGEYELEIDQDGYLRWLIGSDYPGGTFLNTGVQIPLDTWSHIAIRYTTSLDFAIETFVNGQQVHLWNAVGNPTHFDADNTHDQLIIGNREDGAVNSGFIGKIDELRIWNGFLSKATFLAYLSQPSLTGNETHLAAYYPFNQGTPEGDNTGISLLTDMGPNGLDGSLQGFDLSDGNSSSNFVAGISAQTDPACTTSSLPQLSIQYKNAENGPNAPTNKSIKPHLRVHNDGSGPVNLSDITMRYYFTADHPGLLSLSCLASQAGCTETNLSLYDIGSGFVGADHFIEVGFSSTAGSLQSGSRVDTKSRISRTDNLSFDETDDHSYIGPMSNHGINAYVTLYWQGQLIAGTEPMGTSTARQPQKVDVQQTETLAVDVFPNPFQHSFSIEFQEAPTETVEIQILDMMGRIVYQQETDAAQVQVKLPPVLVSGVYLLQLQEGDKQASYKIVKE